MCGSMVGVANEGWGFGEEPLKGGSVVGGIF